MPVIQLLAASLQTGLQMVQGTLADFTDAEFFVRPVPGANHVAWQLGHLMATERRMVGRVNPDAPAPLPEGFAERFTKETASIDDASRFPNKAELMRQFELTRAATVAWCQTLTPEQLDQPTPPGSPAMMATYGQLVTLIPAHTAMHLGQFQVIRRALGKPVLF